MEASFYSPRRSVPARIKYGNTGHRLQEDKDDLPAKDEAEWRRAGFHLPTEPAKPPGSGTGIPVRFGRKPVGTGGIQI